MLRNVLDDFLSRATERQLDLPLLALLSAMGFHDVHLTHGALEFGKDIVARKWDNETEVQYVFQSKAGSIGQSEWRQIAPQLLQAAISNVGHPNLDTALPRQTVLVISGEMTGAARLGLDDLNKGLLTELERRQVVYWDRQNLADHFLQFGLSGIHRATAAGFAEHADFFLTYARALQGTLTDREIESYSRKWADTAIVLHPRLLRAAIEAEVLAQQCLSHGHFYEAVQVHLALLRVICAASYTDSQEELIRVFTEGMLRLHELCSESMDAICSAWEPTKDLVSLEDGSFDMTSYLVHCSRIIEIASLTYFSSNAANTRDASASFLEDFVLNESGCCHPLSDHYAVSIVLAVLALCDSGRTSVARDLVNRTTVWLCDRYELGMGLAGIEADELEETRTLLGYAFDFINIPDRRTSFLATALADLSAFMADHDLYNAVVNDIKACRIHPEYWQAKDTVGSCIVEGEDVIAYPTISYLDEVTDMNAHVAGNHLEDEISSFRFAELLGPASIVVLIALLRDRYFPKTWSRVARCMGDQ